MSAQGSSNHLQHRSVEGTIDHTGIEPLAGPWQFALGLYLLLLLLGSFIVILNVWPGEVRNSASVPRVVGSWLSLQLSIDQRLIVISLVSGAIGSLLHALQSYVSYLGNRRFSRSWWPWYAVRPAIGMALALLCYFAIRGGLVPPGTSEVSPYGVAAMGGLAGLFAKTATQKLEAIFDTALGAPQDDLRDKLREDDAGGEGSSGGRSGVRA
jgi:hypothetical protein